MTAAVSGDIAMKTSLLGTAEAASDSTVDSMGADTEIDGCYIIGVML